MKIKDWILHILNKNKVEKVFIDPITGFTQLRIYHISPMPLYDWECLDIIIRNLHNLEEYTEDANSKAEVFRIKGSNFWVIFYYDWLFNLYYAETYTELSRSYSLGGISLKCNYISLHERMKGVKIQRWYLNYIN